ncbi:MAG: acyl-CoA thioesterase [Alphaproteobacteria bacterium]|nr:acyl-CoA thioesterase [Alphaproteobacteria bacterium]
MPAEIKGRMPAMRLVPLPENTNANGDIFGGWILAQMDLAGGKTAYFRAKGRVVTVGIESMKFHKHVSVGDELSIYTDIVKVGNTSMTIKVESWARRKETGDYVKVTEGLFTFVKIDKDRKPQPVPPAP